MQATKGRAHKVFVCLVRWLVGDDQPPFSKKKRIMGLIKKLFTNCACPQGQMGRAMLKFMNLCHAPLTNWGLKLVDIQDGWTMLDIGCGGGATLQRLLKRSKGA